MRPHERLCLSLVVSLVFATTETHSFLARPSVANNKLTDVTVGRGRTADPHQTILSKLRGGDLVDRSAAQLNAAMTVSALPALVQTSLTSGPYGVAALAGICASVCVPLTQYKSLYGISVGYGLSVAACGFALRKALLPALNAAYNPLTDVLTGATLFYGLRLASYLFVRDVSGWKPLASKNESARLKRIPFALSLSFFYAFMMTPVMYALRHPATTVWPVRIAWSGTVLACAGALLEAVADAQKFVSKVKTAERSDFAGPSTGVYKLTRHPNYTGEILFWLGIFIAGAPSFGKSIVAWLCSSFGLAGIVSIMRGATKSLEKRQKEKYGDQNDYELWKVDVPAPLFPFVKS